MSTGPIVGLGEILWDMLPDGPQPGGAPFNFAFHCHQLGHHAVIVSRVGDDELGRRLLAEVRARGLTDEFIQIDREHPTGTVQVQVDAARQPSYSITENVAYDYLDWSSALDHLARSACAVCFGTLAQRHESSRATIQQFVRQVRQRRGNQSSWDTPPLAVFDINLREPHYTQETVTESLKVCDWLKCNREELEILARFHYLNRALESGLLQQLAVNFKTPLICLTRGELGARVHAKGWQFALPGIPVTVADTIGAGDAFTAGLLCGVLEGQSPLWAAYFASRLAAIVASRSGGTPRVERSEIEMSGR